MNLRELVANAKLRFSQRQMVKETFSFPYALLKPKQILVCLPAGLRELTLVKQYLPALAGLFGNANVTLLTLPGVRVTDIFPRKGFQILTPNPDQVGWSGLPKKTYVKQLQGYNFDVILDLNLEPSVFTSGILLNFPHAIRIGRGNHLGEPYYNVEIKTKFLRDERNIYRSLFETLATITHGTPPTTMVTEQ